MGTLSVRSDVPVHVHRYSLNQSQVEAVVSGNGAFFILQSLKCLIIDEQNANDLP